MRQAVPVQQRIFLIVMVIGFVAFNAWALYTFVTSKYPGANDFFQRWHGARAFWVEGRDPYSIDVAREAEMILYGMPASTDPALDHYPGDFLYPFHMAVVLAPITPMSYAAASAIWLALTGAAIGLCFVLLADAYNWKPSPLVLIFGVIWAITFYPSIRGIFLGQPGTMVVCLQMIAFWALVKRYDVLAGAMLALSTIKPQLGMFLIPFLVLWAIRYQRWRFLTSAAVSMIVLMGISFLLLPQWLSEWLPQATQYSGYTRIGSPVWVITHVYLPFLGSVGEVILTVILVILMLWAWSVVLWQRKGEWFNWTVALTLTVTHLVLLRTATPHFVIYLVVLVLYLREVQRGQGTGAVLAVMVFMTVGLWWLFSATLVNRFESPAMYVPLPFGTLALLLILKQRWRQTFPEGASG